MSQLSHRAGNPSVAGTGADAPVLGSDDTTRRIRRAFERSERALRLRPGLGLHTATSRTTIRDGLACEVTEGRWTLTADLSEKGGGGGAGPDPGVLGRAALGSCLAMGYAMWAAKRNVPLTSISIDIEADFDAGAQYGVSDVPPGYSEVRYVVSIESPAEEAEVLRVLDEAETHSVYMDVFRRAQTLRRSTRISRPER